MGRRARGRTTAFGLFDNNSGVDVDEGVNTVNPLDNDADVDEEDDLHDDGDELADGKGKVRMEKLLAALLGALGIDLPQDVGEKDFKSELAAAALAKIKTLTGKNGGTGKGNSKTNPLLTGQNVNGELLQEEQGPTYMSLGRIANLADPNAQRIALSLADQNQGLRAAKAATARTTARGMADWIAQATATRQRRIALLSATSPAVKMELDVMLGRLDMALSLDSNGAVVDPMAATLATLEHALGDKVPKSLPNDVPAGSTETELDRAVNVLARRMGAR